MSKSTKILKKVSKLNNILNSENGSHIWQFSRVGGVNRVNLETGMDLVSLEYLDQKLWTALSCPVYGMEIDPKTLELIDSDKDERIRVPEILNAVKWITSVINNPDDLVKENKSLPLSAINESTEEGKKLLTSARQILSNLGIPDNTEITVEETSDTVKIFANTKFNGDGIITEDSTDDEKIKKLINDIISCVGSANDLNGKPGISIDHVNDFYKNCEDYSNWYTKAEADIKKILPFADSTAEAFSAFSTIKHKIEDYFLRCRLAEFDSDSVDILNSLNTRYEGISKKDLSSCIDEIAGFTLTKIETKKPLPLTKGINPAWEKAIENLRNLVINPEFPGKENLTETEWENICRKFDDYINWQSEKIGVAVEKLGLSFIRELLKGNSKEYLYSLIEEDKALEENTNNIFLVDKLVRYYRDLYKLLKNYVTFYDFYSPDSKAIFQAGSLYIDQRCCDLCIKVSDMNKHNAIARLSGICLIYCECYSKTKNKVMTIVAALTDGDFDDIEVGRNAIFYDRQGDDWDATIVKIIEHPISIRQAFWSPYKKVSKFISKQIEKFASAKEKEVDTATTSRIEKTTAKVDNGLKTSIQTAPEAPVPVSVPAPPPPHQPFDIGKFVGIFAAISLALGAIGSVIASMLTGFFGLVWWKMPLAITGIILCISGPSMILAWLKLRKRNLAPILDANGWAINARATINIPFGNTLTHLAVLPENSHLNLVDPFVKKKKPFIPILITFFILLCIAAYVLWHYGFLTKWGIL
ncbi:MAG TPA: hypothetical protein PKK00_09620 [Bacteroidales bacterium]|nr:hypothetical protein [Bacteroidales bacterium]HPS15880.1 hypothetical protein [Bacteroidales bacterium]